MKHLHFSNTLLGKIYIIYLSMLCLIPVGVMAQLKSIPIQADITKLKPSENLISKELCSGKICPEGKNCYEGCCIYPLGTNAEGSWNYNIFSDCKPINDLKLSFKVTKDLEAEYDVNTGNCSQAPTATSQKLTSTRGVIVQFNCFSLDADQQKNTGGMIQYIFNVSGQSIIPAIEYPTHTSDGLDHGWPGVNAFAGLQLPKANTLPAGYTLEVDLGTDDNGYVNNVTFTVIDNKGKSYVVQAPKKDAHPPVKTAANPQGATASNPQTLYPARISEFQTNVVSTEGLYVHYKSGGEGTLTYSSKNSLCVEGGAYGYDHCVNTGVRTCESSNAIYGFLSSCCTEPSKSFSQSVKNE